MYLIDEQFFAGILAFADIAAIETVNQCQLGYIRQIIGIGFGWIVEKQENFPRKFSAGFQQIHHDCP